jgi:hypothetical protein
MCPRRPLRAPLEGRAAPNAGGGEKPARAPAGGAQSQQEPRRGEKDLINWQRGRGVRGARIRRAELKKSPVTLARRAGSGPRRARRGTLK